MSFSIKISGKTFSNIVDKTVPYFSTMTGLWLFGEDEAHSQVNLVNGALSTKVGPGTITYGAGYADIPTGTSAGAAIDTGITLSGVSLSSYTFITVASLYEPTPHRLCGTLHSSLIGDAMAQGPVNLSAAFGTPSTSGYTALYNGSNERLISPTVVGAIGFGAVTRSGTATALYLGQGSSLAASTGTMGSGVGDANTYRIGAFGCPENPTANKPQRHVANILCGSALTAAQLLEVYGYLKYKLAKRGVAVA